MSATAQGRADSPYMFVMLSKPSDGTFGWFWRQCQKAGIMKSQCRVVYMIDGPPANTGNKASAAQLRDAKERFEMEVKRSKPKVVIPMGTEAFFAMTGINESILDARGYVIQKDMFHQRPTDVYKQFGTYINNSKATGAKAGDPKMKWVKEAMDALLGSKYKGYVIPVFTLDYIRKQQYAVAPAFMEDLKRARRAAEGGLQMLDPGVMITDVNKLLPPASFGKLMAIDIETHGIDNEVIDLVSFSDGEITAVLKWDEDARRFVDRLFADQTRMWAVHNSPFDLPRLAANGVNITQYVLDHMVFDTMFGAVVIQPDLHKSLGRVAPVYLDCRPWKTSNKKETSHWRAMVRADEEAYAGKDAFFTYWIAVQEIAVMKDLGVYKLFMGTDGHPGPGVMATIPELTRMTQIGVRLNKAQAMDLCQKMEADQFEYFKSWQSKYPGVTFSKNNALQRLFYTTWGLPIYRTTEDSVPVDELALVKLQAYVREHKTDPTISEPWQDDANCTPELFDLMLKMRKNSKMLSTYAQPVLLNSETWVHPSYLPASKDVEQGANKSGEMNSKGNTATGRLATYNPNLANQPKPMRVLYVPDTDDMCFIQRDYKSAELYSLAGYSGDEVLLADLAGDMHQLNADRLGIIRDTAKNVVYASQYLASAGKQSEMILEQVHKWVSPTDCFNISEGIWKNYPDASAYKQLIVELCEAKGYVQNAMGRIRFFHSGRAPSAVDFIPQSTVADILWCVLKDVAVFLRSLGGRLVLTVYDSMLACVPKDKVAEAARGMQRIMERRFDCVRKGFYIPTDLEVGMPGASWGELKKVKTEEALDQLQEQLNG